MISRLLISFAKQRERAYRATGTFDGGRAKAVSQIIRVASYWKGKREEAALRQAKPEIEKLLPPEGSRYQHQRNQILTLLNTYS